MDAPTYCLEGLLKSYDGRTAVDLERLRCELAK
jgi:hypothetical protein